MPNPESSPSRESSRERSSQQGGEAGRSLTSGTTQLLPQEGAVGSRPRGSSSETQPLLQSDREVSSRARNSDPSSSVMDLFGDVAQTVSEAARELERKRLGFANSVNNQLATVANNVGIALRDYWIPPEVQEAARESSLREQASRQVAHLREQANQERRNEVGARGSAFTSLSLQDRTRYVDLALQARRIMNGEEEGAEAQGSGASQSGVVFSGSRESSLGSNDSEEQPSGGA